MMFKTLIIILLSFGMREAECAENNFINVVEKVSYSTVAIALHSPLKHSAPKIMGTGFAVQDGSIVITNYHVVSEILDPTVVEHFVVLTGEGKNVKALKATIDKIDPKNDLAALKIEGVVSPLVLGEDELRKPGTSIAFTGFPIGAVLGLFPATHTGIVAAITPDAIPVMNSVQLSTKMLSRLDDLSLIYQLDATAFPGNSGSPMYDPLTGHVIGVINKVLVKDTLESALSNPSGISYAIPVVKVRNLLQQ
ncbi:S1 family peptidase [Alteromonas sp. A079]|uniref:S1 family peptidase n=1 Tax=Alteromonas sp. A079 TaxID=3410268 RepID=UPI003BA061FA